MESLVPEISLVIPTFRGEGTLPALVEEIVTVLSKRSFEIILVDDGSGEDTRDVLQRICETHDRCRSIILEHNRGQQQATLTGLRECRGGLVVTLDDDGAHDPSEIPGLLEMLDRGYDLVFGVPRDGSPGGVKPGSFLRDWLFYRLLGAPRGVRVSSFRVFRKELLLQALSEPLPGFIYLSALLLRQRPLSGSREVVFRRGGPSRYGFGSRLKLFLQLFYFYGVRRPFRG
jgi:undecaprenyl-phosphate 4-deoxy-4-formamido-L-arabinose transferase